MSEGQIEVGAGLTPEIRNVMDIHGFRTFTAAGRYLLALGLAADWDRRNTPLPSTNPFLEVAWTLRPKS